MQNMLYTEKNKKIKRLFRYMTHAVQLIFFGLLCYALFNTNWTTVFVASQAIAISFIPHALKYFFKIDTPRVFQLGIVSFMFATLILGETARFYKMFWWWDTLLHVTAGIGLTIIAFVTLALFFDKSTLKSTPLFTTMLALSVTIFFAVLWEIYEFFIDLYFNPTNPLQPSNRDTMIDLIVGLLGAAVVGIFGYRFLKWQEGGVVKRLIEDTVQRNKNN